jgi:hypothetical protein
MKAQGALPHIFWEKASQEKRAAPPPIGIGIGIGTIFTFPHFTLAVQSANPSSRGTKCHGVRDERICKIAELAENSEAPFPCW